MTSASARSLYPDLPEPASTPERTAVASVRAEPEPAPSKSRGDRRGRDRRGPLRPRELTTTRARLDGRAPERSFRLVDAGMIGLFAALVLAISQPAGLLQAPLGAAIPYLVGAWGLIWSLEAAGAYRFRGRESLARHLLRIELAFAPVTVGLALLLRLPALAAARTIDVAVFFGICFAALHLGHMAWWSMVSRWRAGGRLTPNIVVIGATKNADSLIKKLLESREANVLGVFDDRLDRAPDNVRGVPVLGDTAALLAHRLTPYVDKIVVTVPPGAQGRVRQIMERLRVLPNPVALFLEFDAASAGASIERLASTSLALLAGAPRNERRAFRKRVQDLVLGSAALLVALPIMALLALAIRLDSPGPILFRQRRHGFNNEEIVVWKFRSMRHEAADPSASRQVEAEDERITRMGRLMRGASLDELPQLFNVLRGEMSLVGPRPHAIGMKTGQIESARLVAEYAHRHRLKPGITGWAAIHGSRGPVDTPESVRRRVALDVEYIERQSFWLDLYILALTLPCLLGDRASVR